MPKTSDMEYEYHRLKAQLAILKDVMQEYPTATIANAAQQIQARIKCIEEIIQK